MTKQQFQIISTNGSRVCILATRETRAAAEEQLEREKIWTAREGYPGVVSIREVTFGVEVAQ